MPKWLGYGYVFTYHDNLYALKLEGSVYKLSYDKSEWAQISDIGWLAEKFCIAEKLFRRFMLRK